MKIMGPWIQGREALANLEGLKQFVTYGRQSVCCQTKNFDMILNSTPLQGFTNLFAVTISLMKVVKPLKLVKKNKGMEKKNLLNHLQSGLRYYKVFR